MCSRVSILPLFVNFLFNFGHVPTVWYFFLAFRFIETVGNENNSSRCVKVKCIRNSKCLQLEFHRDASFVLNRIECICCLFACHRIFNGTFRSLLIAEV